MKLTKLKLLGACAVIGAFATTPASAEWIQYGENGMKTTNLGGAGVATADDIDVWYTNPAGAARFTRPQIGFSLKALNTTNLENKEPGFNNGVRDTVSGSDNAYLPSVSVYVPGLLPNVTLGVGFGTVAALAASWGNRTNVISPSGPGSNNQGFTRAELLVTETSPTVAIKLSDKLNVGVSLGLATVKHLLVDVSLAGVGTLRAQTDDDVGLPIPPWGFATSPSEATFTIGAQYQLLPNVAIGGVFRSEAPTEYDVNLTLNTGAVFGLFERNRGKLKLEIPRHVQIGASVDVTPTLKVHADVKWTNWANATGVGSPLVVQVAPGGLLGGAVTQLVANQAGSDTYAFRFGVQWRALPNLELQAGYHYDPAVFDKKNLSYLYYSSDRHIFSLGASLDVPDSALLGSSGDWEFTVGGQLISYEDVTVQPGQSSTFGLTGPTAASVLGGNPTAPFSANAQQFDLGGYIWTAGVQAVYKFGAPEEVYLK